MAVLVDDILTALAPDAAIATYVGDLLDDDSLAGAWKRNLLPGAAAALQSELEAGGPGEAAQEALVLAAISTSLGEAVLLDGGVVTDHGAEDSKVDVTAGRLLVDGAIVSFGATAAGGLATLDTKTISVNKTTGVISSNTGVPAGGFSLATVAVSANVCTPTDTRKQILAAVAP
jgi:hypothetical protein